MKKRVVIGICVLMMGATWLPATAQTDDGLHRGLAGLQRKEYAEAEQLFSGLLRQQPENVKAQLLRGEALFYRKDYERALMDFYSVEQKKPGMASLWIARTYAVTGDREKAIRSLEEHLKSLYRRPESEIMLDTLLQPLEHTAAWRALWKKEWYTRREKGISEARYELEGNHPGEAVRVLDPLLAQYPGDAAMLALRGRAYLQSGDLRKAGQDISRALSLQPEDSVSLYTAAQLAIKKGKFEEGAAYLMKLFDLVPAGFSLLLQSSDALAEAGLLREAMKPLRQYMEYFPDDVEAMFRAGELAGKLGDYRNALRYLSEVIDKDPSVAVHFVARADMYVKVHTYRYAVDDYAMALDLDPTNGDIYLSRAKVYLQMGDTKNACFDLKQALHYGKKEAVTYLQKYCGY